MLANRMVDEGVVLYIKLAGTIGQDDMVVAENKVGRLIDHFASIMTVVPITR